MSSEYWIDKRLVTEEEFNLFLATLKGRSAWFCEESTEGGSTGYQARDASGKYYNVRITSEPGDSSSRINAVK